MLSPFELEKKCVDIFQRLGWGVSVPKLEKDYGYDITLTYKGKICGYVQVCSRNNLKQMLKNIDYILEFINEKKAFFIITNGYAYDLYIGNEFFGCLSVPPTPEEIELLLGGANNE